MAKRRASNGKTSEVRPAADVSSNKLLAALPAAEYRRLQPLLTRTALRQRQVLHTTGERLQAVYFPLDGICSLLTTMEDGRMLEVASVGNEGMTGISAFFEEHFPDVDVITHVAGTCADVMSIAAFSAEMRRRGPLYQILCGYAHALIGVLMQAAACNGLHAADERCARWLLHTHDRIGKDTFPLTQETLAVMLGVRRATITAVASQLQRAELVEFGRRRITIRNRAGLEAIACECYRVIRERFDRLH